MLGGSGMKSSLRAHLSAVIVQAYSTGHSSHGPLELSVEDFKTRLIGIVTKHVGPDHESAAAINFLKTLHTSDLYLGLACARGAEAAWERLTRVYGTYIKSLATFATVGHTAATEVANNVLVDLFLPGPSGQSRIASYEGRSSLATWLRVVVSHHATNERQRFCNSMGGISVPDLADEGAPSRMDASLRALRYERIIGDSLQCSFESLTNRERLILLLRYDEGLHLGQIARLLGVHQSTITRQLERACKRLREEVIGTLSKKHKLDRIAISECEEDLLENPTYSVLALLKRGHENK
jgi:RNA polymerase sigma-70 factor